MKAVTAKQIQKLDAVAIHQYGIPSVVLMENAGQAVFQEVIRRRMPQRVCVVCGVGNNAGDGFVVARHLVDAGVPTDVLLLGQSSSLKTDALLNYNLLRGLRCRVQVIRRITPRVVKMLSAADVTVDAIFGVGLNREITGTFAEMITAINENARFALAVDVPSGLDATTGQIYGCCVKARKTVTFTFAKKGMMIKEGPRHVGILKVAAIGIPRLIQARVIK